MDRMFVTRRRNEEEKIPFERFSCRGENNIKIGYLEDGMVLAALIWRAFINNVMKFRGPQGDQPYKSKIFLFLYLFYNALCFLLQNLIRCSSYMLSTTFHSRAIPNMS